MYRDVPEDSNVEIPLRHRQTQGPSGTPKRSHFVTGKGIYVTRSGAKKQEPAALLFDGRGGGDHQPIASDDLSEDDGRNVPAVGADLARPGGLGAERGGCLVRADDASAYVLIRGDAS